MQYERLAVHEWQNFHNNIVHAVIRYMLAQSREKAAWMVCDKVYTIIHSTTSWYLLCQTSKTFDGTDSLRFDKRVHVLNLRHDIRPEAALLPKEEVKIYSNPLYGISAEPPQWLCCSDTGVLAFVNKQNWLCTCTPLRLGHHNILEGDIRRHYILPSGWTLKSENLPLMRRWL